MEKLQRLKNQIQPETASDELLNELLTQAADIVLNRRYPFGAPEGVTIPTQYESIQVRIAVELFNKRGAEGQTAHSENGISRTYEASDVSPSLLKQIVPLCGSVM